MTFGFRAFGFQVDTIVNCRRQETASWFLLSEISAGNVRVRAGPSIPRDINNKEAPKARLQSQQINRSPML